MGCGGQFPSLDPQRNRIIHADLPFNTNTISPEEVQNAVANLKNKAARADGSIAELFKLLNRASLASLVRCLTSFWLEQKVADSFTQARVCCLYTKGAHANPENNRPIFLLNTCIKCSSASFKSDFPLS